MVGGANDPRAHPTYTHKYAYRGLIPMDKATSALGAENAQNAKLHMGQDGHVLTFPVSHGETMNVVCFKDNQNDWPSPEKLTLPTTKEAAKEDFAHFGPTVKHIIDLLEPNLDCWAIFDLGDHPMKFYNKGRVCLLGDAGHATSPHHGAGAGFCIEDAAVMCELLADTRVKETGRLEAAFRAFSDSRIERANWLIQSSRRTGNLYDWMAEGVGKDVKKIEKECRERDEKIWNADMGEMVEDAKRALGKALGD